MRHTKQHMEQEQQLTIDQLIEAAFDFSDYTEEQKKELINETSSMIMEASLIRSLTEAGEETQNIFQTFIVSNPSEDDMAQFIEQHLPSFQSIVLEELDIFLNSEDADEVASL